MATRGNLTVTWVESIRVALYQTLDELTHCGLLMLCASWPSFSIVSVKGLSPVGTKSFAETMWTDHQVNTIYFNEIPIKYKELIKNVVYKIIFVQKPVLLAWINLISSMDELSCNQ